MGRFQIFAREFFLEFLNGIKGKLSLFHARSKYLLEYNEFKLVLFLELGSSTATVHVQKIFPI